MIPTAELLDATTATELDLGIQNAIQRAYGLKARPKPKDVRRFGQKWRPHATTACWYMWRSLENGDGQGDA